MLAKAIVVLGVAIVVLGVAIVVLGVAIVVLGVAIVVLGEAGKLLATSNVSFPFIYMSFRSSDVRGTTSGVRIRLQYSISSNPKANQC